MGQIGKWRITYIKSVVTKGIQDPTLKLIVFKIDKTQSVIVNFGSRYKYIVKQLHITTMSTTK